MADFKIFSNSDKALTGSVSWQCPSNIAIVKYWGKFGEQFPRNASVSFTLSNAHTNTSIAFAPKSSEGIELAFRFEGQSNEAFGQKIKAFFAKIIDRLPWLENYAFEIESENSFPHSSGIASSASAMAAIAMCLMDIEKQLFDLPAIDIAKASYFARLGSGSAARSVISTMGQWGKHPEITNSTNDYAIEVPKMHSIFQTFRDDIMIVSAAEKSVSSRAGHALMENNVFSSARYQQANDRLAILMKAIESGDVETFGKIAEEEALTLHALMMCSEPSYILLKPNTLKMIELIQDFRAKENVPVYFTLDAGPNIHLLYPKSAESKVVPFRDGQLKPLCENGVIILDEVGNGPIKLS